MSVCFQGWGGEGASGFMVVCGKVLQAFAGP